MTPIISALNEFQVNEYNIMHYRENVKLYDMYISARSGIEHLISIQLVDIRVINNYCLEFKFINMNLYSKDNYDKVSGHTNIIIDNGENLMYVNYITYTTKERSENSKVINSSSYSLNNDMNDFFKYLYKIHSNINKSPRSRL